MLISTNQISPSQLPDLKQLLADCQLEDKNNVNIYSHILTQKRALPVNTLYYQQKKLAGFISVYFFYEDSCEISLMVSPFARRKGLSTKLIQSILPIIQSQKIKTLIFTRPHQLNDHWLSALGFKYRSSEYRMGRHQLQPVLSPQLDITFVNASNQHIPDLKRIDKACFPTTSQIKPRFSSLIEDRNYQLILACHQNNAIGKAHIRWNNKGAVFSDIGILPELQGRGYGNALLSHCINFALAEGKFELDLDVETRNNNALSLYTRLGFKLLNVCDYWTIALQQLTAIYTKKT